MAIIRKHWQLDIQVTFPILEAGRQWEETYLECFQNIVNPEPFAL